MIDLLEKIYPLALAPNSPDTDRCVEILKQELPFVVHEYKPGEEYNGWVVPKSWHVETALIKKGGKVIYDGTQHPLGVYGYSQSFTGKITWEELDKHISYRKDMPEAIGYYCDLYYKPTRQEWGFSMPYSFYKTLGHGDYEIELKTVFDNERTLKVCEYELHGKTKETICFVAHNCHAGQADDDISGVVVGVELMKELAKKDNKYSYRLIVCPEHFGSIFYLRDLDKTTLKNYKFSFFLEMLGNKYNGFCYQETFTGEAEVDLVFKHYLGYHYSNAIIDIFRKVVGNDEVVWEAPGYEIPMASFSRARGHKSDGSTAFYPEYHTNFDNVDLINKEKLEESVKAMMDIIFVLETNTTLKRKFEGLIALSNQKYDLYISPGTDPSLREERQQKKIDWNYMMDCLPRYFNGKCTILDIARKHNLSYHDVYQYLKKFEEKGLIEFN